MVFKNGVKNIQAAAYNDMHRQTLAHMVSLDYIASV